MTFPSPYFVAVAFLPALLGVIILAGWLGSKLDLHTEMVRKTVHIVLGLSTLSFPWLIPDKWAVWLLAGLALLFFAALRLQPSLKASLGAVLGGVGRGSVGEFVFPIAVALVFHLSEGDPLRFGIPVLILTLADATGALVGSRYGGARYKAGEGFKSVEGSAAFFVVAFLSVHVPLLLSEQTGRGEALLIAVLLGLLVMIMEAVSWRGLDNIFVPLLAFFVLERSLSLSSVDLAFRVGLLLLLALFAFGFRNRTLLESGALLGALLFGFVFWSFGGWLWLAPLLLLYVCYVCLPKPTESERPARDFQAVLRIMSGPTLFLSLAYFYTAESAWLGFLYCFGAHMANILVSRSASWRCGDSGLLRTLGAVVVATSVVVVVTLLLAGQLGLATISGGVLATLLSASAFTQLPRQDGNSLRGRLWFRESLLATAAAAVGLLPVYIL